MTDTEARLERLERDLELAPYQNTMFLGAPRELVDTVRWLISLVRQHQVPEAPRG